MGHVLGKHMTHGTLTNDLHRSDVVMESLKAKKLILSVSKSQFLIFRSPVVGFMRRSHDEPTHTEFMLSWRAPRQIS